MERMERYRNGRKREVEMMSEAEGNGKDRKAEEWKEKGNEEREW